MKITEKDLANWFTYHKPNDAQNVKFAQIRIAAYKLADAIVKNSPEGPDQEAAVRKVREAVMTANAAIAGEGR